MPVNHYENFPVASFLLPRRVRDPITLIYNFARQADDFADEGEIPDARRLELLQGFRAELDRIAAGEIPQTPLFQQLAEIIREHNLPLDAFHDLLDAFSQDVIKKRYANFAEVMDYCRRSANPVGRLLLHLFGAATEQNLAFSDSVCSSLQLINFWQDVALDYQKNRIYLPQDEMAAHGVTESHIAERKADSAWQALMRFQIERASHMLQSGAPLGRILPGRIGLEIRMTIEGGATILRKLEMSGADMFNHRPVLNPRDWIYMFYRSVLVK